MNSLLHTGYTLLKYNLYKGSLNDVKSLFFMSSQLLKSLHTPTGYKTDTNQHSYETKPFNMNKKLTFGKFVYFTAAVVSLSAFIFTTVDLIVEYCQEKTGFNIVEHAHTKLELPAATICITDTFRNVDETNPDEILSNLTAHTFSANHIFYRDFEELKEQYVVQETFNYKNGHCFTLRTSEKQIKNGAIGRPLMYLELKKAHKYKVYI